MGDNMDSLKLRRPDLFTVHVTQPPNPRKGEGKMTFKLRHLAKYRNNIIALIFRKEMMVQAMREADEKAHRERFESDGGFEVSK